MTTRFQSGVIAAGILTAVAGLAADARGQVRTWNAPANGNWNVAANWNLADVPDTAAETALISTPGVFWVTIPSGYSPTVGTLTIGPASGSVLRSDSGTLNVGAASNDAIIQIGTGGANGTYLRATGATTLSGSGIVRLQAGTNLDTGAMYWVNNAATQYFVQNASHSITGTGNIAARLDSAGRVEADVAGAILQLFSQDKTNTGLMRASGGGILRLNAIGLTNTGGTIESLGGTVQILNSTVDGGSLTNTSGTMSVLSGNSVFSSVASAGLIQMDDNSTLRIGGTGLVNNGTVVVNTGVGANLAAFRAAGGNRVLSGSGTIVLNASANIDTAIMQWTSNSTTETFTQASGHTIRGTGHIYATLTNSGLVHADQNGKVLRLSSRPKTNDVGGVMRSSGGGVLELSGITVVNDGVIEALTGSVVQLSSGGVAGGTLSSAGTGLFRTVGVSGLTDVVINAPARIVDNADLRGTGTLTNNGVLTVNETAGANNTILRSQGGLLAINGTGEVVLNASANLDTAYLLWNSNSSTETMTQGAGHTLRGTGNVYVNFTNNGLVNADQSGKILQMLSQVKTNNATFRASNGGQLALTGITVNNTGTIEALDGSIVQINAAAIIGGTLNSAGTGLFRTAGISYLQNLTNNAPVAVANNSELRGIGTLVNNAVITVSDGASANPTVFKAQNGTLSLNGSGTIVLNASPNLDTAYMYWNSNSSTETITQAASHTVRGTGNIYVNFTNNGLVHADQSGKVLQLLSHQKTNNSVFRASNSGQLVIAGITVTNNGTIEALNGSLVQINAAAIVGGTLNTAGTGTFRSTGVSYIQNVTNNAPFSVTNNSELRGTGTLVNNAVITVSDGVGANPTVFKSQGGALALSGAGSLILNATANFDTAYLYWNSNSSTETISQASGHTIGGNGNIYVRFTNSGTLSPGVTAGSAGRLNFPSQPCTLTSTSRYVCNINGTAPAQYDRLTGGASIALNGTLAVQFGYPPNISDQFDVVGAPYTGRFTRLELPKGYYIEYLPSIVRVIFSGCMGDWDQDGDVDSDDVNLFFADFENGESDIDNDGDTDSDDIIEFFGRFESGC